MIRYLIFVFLSLIFSCNPLLASDKHAQAKITLKVVDEQGIPIRGARAGISFEELLSWDSKSTQVNGTTDDNGLFTASGRTSKRTFWGANTTGYYPSNGTYILERNKEGRWEPWNPEITVVLRKKENPVPMYLRDTHETGGLVIPIVGVEIGFDLIEYDWVPPYGKGKMVDFIFRADKRYTDDKDFDCTLTITFPNKYDGIQSYLFDRKDGSTLKLSRYAPEGGYQPKLIRTVSRKPGGPIIGGYRDNDYNYYFRVRSEEKDGKLERAMYGKIHGDFAISARSEKTANIVFKYFLNPDYTRNLEFGENLFDGLNVGIE